MKNLLEHPLLGKIISFLISVVIVLIIFVGIVGIVFPLMLEARFESVKVISIISMLIGALIILIARHWPLMRFISFIKKPRGQEYETKIYDFAGSLVIGLAFLAAGVLYMYFENPNMMIIPFIGAAFLIRILILYINHRIKEQSRPSASLPKKK